MPEIQTSPEERQYLLKISVECFRILKGNLRNEDSAEIMSAVNIGLTEMYEKKIPWEEGVNYVLAVARNKLRDLHRKRSAQKRGFDNEEDFQRAVFGRMGQDDLEEYGQFLHGGFRDEILEIEKRIRAASTPRMQQILDIIFENLPEGISNEKIRLELLDFGVEVSEATVQKDRRKIREMGRAELRKLAEHHRPESLKRRPLENDGNNQDYFVA